MVYVKLENLEKSFDSVVAVNNINIKIEESEFFTILGPSGCGKTTTLRMIAGFYKPDKGKIYFNDKEVHKLPPEKRNTGMVFQNYALWPHMTVFKNVAFGLEMRKLPKEEIKSRVMTTLDLVNLEGFGDRTPDQLSGGQQQRVALARALVIEPDVLLLDEPLSNLDAKLRVEMRTEIKKLQKNLGITTIYVTHDQKEALAVSDRLAVMGMGKIEQVGKPLEIYTKPSNKFVASFIGLINLFNGIVSKIRKDDVLIRTNEGLNIMAKSFERVKEGMKVLLAVRPEHVEVHSQDFGLSEGNIVNGIIESVEYLGDLARYGVKTRYQIINADQYSPSVEKSFKLGEKVIVYFGKEDVHLIEVL
jgi:iron(III) transport system ATP-binding protein